MTTWFVQYWPLPSGDIDPHDAGSEIACFRICPEGEPDRWIVQTNPNLPRQVQEETAHLVAELLSELLGV